MKWLLPLLALLLLAPSQAKAVDCSLDAAACRCVGFLYKDKSLSAPNDISLPVRNWERIKRIMNRRLNTHVLVSIAISYESNGTHICCEWFDNWGSSVPYDAVTLSHVTPGDTGERDVLLIGAYDAAPEYGDWNEIINGDATTAAAFSFLNEITSSVAAAALAGDSRAAEISKNQTLLNRARTNRSDALRSKILNDGCAMQ